MQHTTRCSRIISIILFKMSGVSDCLHPHTSLPILQERYRAPYPASARTPGPQSSPPPPHTYPVDQAVDSQQSAKEAQLEQKIQKSVASMLEESKVAKVHQIQQSLAKQMVAFLPTYEQFQVRRKPHRNDRLYGYIDRLYGNHPLSKKEKRLKLLFVVTFVISDRN